MCNPLRILGTWGAALLLMVGLPAALPAQIYTRPVYVPPTPPPAPRIVYYSPSGPVLSDYRPSPFVVPPTRYSFYEVPSPVGRFPVTTLYYPAAPVGAPVFIPNNYLPGYPYEPGYYSGYYTPGYFRY